MRCALKTRRESERAGSGWLSGCDNSCGVWSARYELVTAAGKAFRAASWSSVGPPGRTGLSLSQLCHAIQPRTHHTASSCSDRHGVALPQRCQHATFSMTAAASRARDASRTTRSAPASYVAAALSCHLGRWTRKVPLITPQQQHPIEKCTITTLTRWSGHHPHPHLLLPLHSHFHLSTHRSHPHLSTSPTSPSRTLATPHPSSHPPPSRPTSLYYHPAHLHPPAPPPQPMHPTYSLTTTVPIPYMPGTRSTRLHQQGRPSHHCRPYQPKHCYRLRLVWPSTRSRHSSS